MQTKLQQFFAAEEKVGADGQLYRPASTSLRLWEALELQRLVSESSASETLEIGLALGASAVAIAEALEHKGSVARHVVLDPYQADYGNVGLRELERLGLLHRVEFKPVFSHDFLHDCSKQGRRFDLIFNDGAHSVGSKVADTFLADRCLKPGGFLAFHDAFIFAVAASVRYLARELGYEVVHLLPDSRFKRLLRALKYGSALGCWYGTKVVPSTAGAVVALRKPLKQAK
jgi:predicted O-methyltransferase YrrM